MGVDYDAFLGIGKRMLCKEEVEDFLKKHTYLDEEQLEALFDAGSHLGLTVVCLDCYSAEDWFVGFESGGEHPDTLISDIVDSHERWKVMFKDVEPRVVHAVKIW